MKCFGNRTVNFIIKLVLLDDQEIIQEAQRTSRGQELLDNVFRHLNIIETAYFGLRFLDSYGQPHWLDGSKSVIKQISDSRTLYFGVKFYAADPCKLFEEITRYQFFLQIKKDILQGRLTVNQELASELGAYAVQSELGDYDPRRHVPGYISEFRFVANQSAELEAAIGELHKSMIGQVPAVSELNYLEKVKWLDMYGVDLHPVLGEDKIDYFLGLTPSAIIVLRNKTKVGNYFWPRITKLSMKGKYFMVRVKGRTEEQTYGFETPSKSACKHLWRSASEHHTFFRLVQVTPTPHANKSFTLGSRFRDSRSSDSSARRRAQPQFIRTPSRKYTRRYVEGSDNNNQHGQQQQQQSMHNSESQSKSKDWTTPAPLPPLSLQQRDTSPRSTRSVHVASRKYNVPSPRSSRSAHVSYGHRRSQSVESNSSVESTSRRHSRRRSKKKSSDAESEASTRSNKKRYRHRRSSGGSDSEPCRHKRTHNNEPVRWKEATMIVPVVQSVSNVVDLNNKDGGGVGGGGSNSNSNTQTRSKRRSSHMRKKEKYLSEELKKHLDFELIDTTGMSYEERRRIGYKRVDVGVVGGHHNNNHHRQSSGHHNSNTTSGQEPKMNLAGESPPPPYTSESIPSECGGPGIIPSPGAMGQSFGLPSSNCLASSSHSISSYTSAVHSKEPKTTQHTPKRPHHHHQQQQQQQQQQQPQQPQQQHHHHQMQQQPQQQPQQQQQLQGNFSYNQSPTLSNNPHLKIDPFHEKSENSDSGLGTDREYYRGENMSSLSYALNLSHGAAPQPQHPSSSTQNNGNNLRDTTNYWNALKSAGDPGCDIDISNWGHPTNHGSNHSQSHGQSNHFDGSGGGNGRSSSLQLILSPLVSSTRTRL